MTYDREEVARRLATVGEIARDHVLSELRRQSSESLSTIAFETAADKVYVIDRSVEAALLPALEDAIRYDTKLVVERGIPGRDVEVALLGRDPVEASVPGEIRTRREFYDYEAKYVDEDTELLVPAPVSESLATALKEASIRAFRALEGDGFARVDFLVHRDTEEFYINELNSLPGFTEVSMYPRMWEASGLPYPALLDRLIDLAIVRHERRSRRAGKQR